MAENLNLKTVETVDTRPFRKLVMTIGELPTSFIESMTYYELLAWFTNYLETVIIPTVNNNGEAVEELQDKFIELKNDTEDEITRFETDITATFNQLKDFVDNYFDNLDVQEEINNKLDAMAEDGTLQEIIASYLNANAVWGFDTVNDMVNAPNLINGSFARTLGYRAKNDGGSGLYKIRTITNDDVVDGGSIIEMADDTLIAELIVDGKVVPEQFGAYGDGTHDDIQYLNSCRNFCTAHNVLMSGLSDSIYAVTEGFTMYNGCSYDFNLATFKALNAMTYVIRNHRPKVDELVPVTNEYTKNMVIDCAGVADYGFYQDRFGWSVLVDNIRVLDPKEIGIYIYIGQIRLTNSKVEQTILTQSCVGLQLDSADNEVNNLVVRNCTTGIKVNGTNNSISEAHPVMRSNGKVNGSVGFDLYQKVKLVNCTADTFNYSIRVNNNLGFSSVNFFSVTAEVYSESDATEAPYFVYSSAADDITISSRISMTGSIMTRGNVFNNQPQRFTNLTYWSGTSLRNNNPELCHENLEAYLPRETTEYNTRTNIASMVGTNVTAGSAWVYRVNNLLTLRLETITLPTTAADANLVLFENLPTAITPKVTLQKIITTRDGVKVRLVYRNTGSITITPYSSITSGDIITTVEIFPSLYQ